VTNTYPNEQLARQDDLIPAPRPSVSVARRRIGAIRVVVVNDLIHDESDFSDVARAEPNFDERAWVKRDRYIAGLALPNIENNIRNLAESPEVLTLHLSEVDEETISAFDADAVVLSGTLRDFDLYRPDMIEKFGAFVRSTDVPVLGICGGHQLVGLSFGVDIVTLDRKTQAERRENRLVEYQYRYVKIVRDDPIFDRIDDHSSDSMNAYRVGSLAGGVRPARVGLPLPDSDDGSAKRHAADLFGAIPHREVIRGLEPTEILLGPSRRVARRPHHL
jgi:hypothetical protein